MAAQPSLRHLPRTFDSPPASREKAAGSAQHALVVFPLTLLPTPPVPLQDEEGR